MFCAFNYSNIKRLVIPTDDNLVLLYKVFNRIVRFISIKYKSKTQYLYYGAYIGSDSDLSLIGVCARLNLLIFRVTETRTMYMK